MFNLSAVQSAIQQLGFDGWLLYDFRSLNVLARRVVGLGNEAMLSRRWFYFIPAQGEPRKLVHRIEPCPSRCNHFFGALGSKLLGGS